MGVLFYGCLSNTRYEREGKKLDFTLLRKRIKERYGTFGAFADEMGIPKQRMSRMLTGKTDWSLDEVAMAAEMLGITDKILEYFFTKKSLI